MEVHLTPEQEARLSRMARHAGKPPEQLVTETILSLLDDDEGFRLAVQRGLAQADAGIFIEEEEMERAGFSPSPPNLQAFAPYRPCGWGRDTLRGTNSNQTQNGDS